MADIYQSTDRKSIDTRPESPRLLLEGIATIAVADFAAVTGGFQGSVNIDITEFNDIGNTNKVFSDPATYEVEVIHYYPSTSEFDIFRRIPYTFFSNYATGVVDRQAYWQVTNQHVLVDNIYVSTLTITYFADTNSGVENDDAGDAQHFLYKIWSTKYAYEV